MDSAVSHFRTAWTSKEYVHRCGVGEARACSVSQSEQIVSAIAKVSAAVVLVVFMAWVSAGGEHCTLHYLWTLIGRSPSVRS